VVAVDVRKEVVDSVNDGTSYINEKGVIDAVKKAVGRGDLTATLDIKKAVSDSKATIIAVQTPFERGRTVLGPLKAACRDVASAVGEGSVVILESTVPPGTCEKVVLPMFERMGKKEGSDFYFAYCPERIAPGNSLEEFVNNERIVGAGRRESSEKAVSVLRRAVKGRLVETDLLSAETTKLVENAARDVYIAFANDLAKISTKIGVDVREVIRLANTHPRVKILNPGPGVGGPCLTKDPYLLLDGIGEDESGMGVMIRTARSVNDSMSREVLRLVRSGGGARRGSKVAVLGTAYKPEVGDPRASPSRPVIESLLSLGFDVHAYDPYCSESFGAKRAASMEEAVSEASVAVVMVAHGEFAKTSPGEIAKMMGGRPLIVDAARAFGGSGPGEEGYLLLRLGDGTSGTESERRRTRENRRGPARGGSRTAKRGP
jgi:UDP-N-acetyl-D-mannosaminuronic acid dehydrogenase